MVTTVDPQPYYVGKAQAAMTRAGAPAADVTALALWAAQHRDDNAGVLVDPTGRLVATTRHHSKRGKASAHYIDELLVDTTDLNVDPWLHRTVLDMAMGQLRRALGVPLVHLRASELTRGPAIRP